MAAQALPGSSGDTIGNTGGDNSGIGSFVGALNYKVDSQSGAFTYQVPIAVPPARQGAQPKLQLAYNSRAANGWCGMGWSLDIGQIERDTRFGPPIRWVGANAQQEYDDAKGFMVSMGGVNGRLVPTSRTDEYRLQIQTVRLVFRLNRSANHWTITDSAGNKFYFGQSTASRMDNTRWTATGPGQTVRWCLDRVLDVNGNETLITWQRDQQLLYPLSIAYNGNVNLPALGHPALVSFTWEERSDKTLNFRPGFRVEQRQRLKRVETFVNTTRAARYELGYIPSPLTGRSLLDTVSLYGWDNATALAPLRFTYSQTAPQYTNLMAWPRQGTGLPPMPYVDAPGQDVSYALLDLDGDGRPDRVWRYKDQFSRYYWMMEKNNGNGFDAAVAYGNDIPYSSLGVLPPAADSYTGFGGSIIYDLIGGQQISTCEAIVDINGDGLVDRLVCNGSFSQHYVQLNTGTEMGPLISWPGLAGMPELTRQYQITENSTSSLLMLLDVNGDGKPDRIYIDSNNSFKVQFNTGNGWAPPVVWQGQVGTHHVLSYTSKYSVLGAQFANSELSLLDLNGDGLPDRVTVTAQPNQWEVQYNTGDGFGPPEVINMPGGANQYVRSWGEFNGYTVSQGMADWNGDGLPDLQSPGSDGHSFNFFPNKGLADAAGQQFSQVISGPGHLAEVVRMIYAGEYGGFNWYTPSWLTKGGKPEWMMKGADDATGQGCFRDINGDGLPDRVVIMNDLRSAAEWGRWVYTDDPDYPPQLCYFYGDFSDPLFKDAPFARSQKLYAQLNQGQIPDLLTRISNPLSGSVGVAFVPSTSFDNTDQNGKHLLPAPAPVVQSITLNDGFGNTATNTYAYSGGFFDGLTREFRGFHRVEEVNPFGIKTVTCFYQGGGGYDGSAAGEYQDQYAKKGVPYLVEVYGTDGALVHRTLNKVEVAQPETGIDFPYLSQTIKMDFTDATHYRATATQLTYDTTTGNVRTSLNLGEVRVVDQANHTFTDVDPSDNVRTETTYKVLDNTDIVNKPDIITISKPDLTDPHKTRFSYDAAGNLTLTEVWLNPGDRWISKGQVDYDLGNPWRSTDAVGVVTETTYDNDFKTFPVLKTTAPRTSVAMTAKALFDARSGQVLRATNHLGVIVKTDYDVFFRPTTTYVNQAPFAEPTLWRTRTDYTLNGISGTACNNQVHQAAYDPNDTVNGIESFAYLDGFGRTIQVRAESETAGVFRCVDTFHDDNLRNSFSPNPYFANGSAYAANTSPQLGAFTEFDTAGRPCKVTPAARTTYNANRQRSGSVTSTGGDSSAAPVGAASTVCGDSNAGDPWVSIATDPESKVTRTYQNAFGRTTRIVKVTSQGDISTSYAYDLTGNLTQVQDNNSHITQIGYDSLGRKTSMTDPDMGTWTYQYDDAGRLTDQYDAKNQHIHFIFEPLLGRVQTKQIYDQAGVLKREVKYQYDQPVKSGYSVQLGQLAAVTDHTQPTGCVGNQRFWSYDYKDRVLKEAVYAWPFGTFVTDTAYNEADQVTQINYPNDVARIQYTYQNGVLNKVQSLKGTGDHSEVFYQVASMNEFGQVTAYQTHNGQVNHTTEFYANSKRLKTMSSAKGSAAILSKTYTFDRVSNVKSITDNVPEHTGLASGSLQNLFYDDLHRLTDLTDASGAHSYTYDALGNITANSDGPSGAYTYGSSRPHAVTAVNGQSYAYDTNGNMISRKDQTLTYDEENRLIHVANGTTCDVYFGYDYAGARLWKFNKTSDQ